MHVDISREPKLSKIDHLFVLLAEGKHDLGDVPEPIRKAAERAVADAKFEGRSDESITILAGEPRKLTLISIGKSDAVSLRAMRAGLTAAGRIAKRHRDKQIAVVFPYTLPGLDAARPSVDRPS